VENQRVGWGNGGVTRWSGPFTALCYASVTSKEMLQSSDQLLLVTRYPAYEMEVYPVKLRVNS
jgi:hypothetical protein